MRYRRLVERKMSRWNFGFGYFSGYSNPSLYFGYEVECRVGDWVMVVWLGFGCSWDW